MCISIVDILIFENCHFPCTQITRQSDLLVIDHSESRTFTVYIRYLQADGRLLNYSRLNCFLNEREGVFSIKPCLLNEFTRRSPCRDHEVSGCIE